MATQQKRGARKRAGPSTEATILATAERLFARHGYDSVSTKQLAEESGVTIGALYHHFASKSALYEAATQRAFSRRSAAPRLLIESSDPPEQRLRQLVSWFVGSIITDKNFGLLLRRELLDPRAQTKDLGDMEAFHQALELFKELIGQLAPETDADAATASMAALAFGFASLKGIYAIVPSIRKTLSTPDEIAVYATKLLLGGLRG